MAAEIKKGYQNGCEMTDEEEEDEKGEVEDRRGGFIVKEEESKQNDAKREKASCVYLDISWTFLIGQQTTIIAATGVKTRCSSSIRHHDRTKLQDQTSEIRAMFAFSRW